ncbi:MAG TPA: mechanosensitive ion channel domain-containing protein [Burkholderiaceae bacterium]|nr:mechanosensitive ion channel domain-containing protein [Burkholderiaceae bacterium]HSC00040.1 mechanosensitive ion channel domain-containing protein [Burkholderiaceae bacterium]
MQAGETLAEIWAALTRASALAELAVLLACVLLAWGLARLARRHAPSSVWFAKRTVDGALFPLLALLLVVVARAALAKAMPIGLLRLAVPILASLAIIRLLARVLAGAFPQSAAVRAFVRTVSWLVWLGMVLWITDLLPMLIDSMEEVKWRIGGSTISLLAILQGTLTALVALLAVLWLSTLIEARLMRASRVNLSVRKIAANATRALLLLVGTLVALSAAGIPLTALSVLGGAIGVGIGFGLQKLAANYVSGFVILAERSLRIGDTVKVDGFEGRITDITTRYTVVRALNGRESLVPNEMMITQRVENATLADPRVALSTTVQVAYGTDLERLLPKLTEVVHAVPRVLADPPSAVQLSSFAADGLELTIVFWIGDIENGTGGVRSDVNLALLRCLNEQGVEIPYPQRVMRQA